MGATNILVNKPIRKDNKKKYKRRNNPIMKEEGIENRQMTKFPEVVVEEPDYPKKFSEEIQKL